MRPLHHRDTFQLSTYQVSLVLCGVTMYATENGLFTANQAEAFTDFGYHAALRIKRELERDQVSDGAASLSVQIVETTNEY
jgi:hypothetical protein